MAPDHAHTDLSVASPFRDYDPFAWVYNEHWGHMFSDRVLPVLQGLLLVDLPAGARVLDLCCGTGQLAAMLTAEGYRVVGVDASPEMLRYARQNAPEADFLEADARAFELPETVDGALCVFDSLNHVLALDDLAAVFRRVHAALGQGGAFVFDLNMEEGFRQRWQRTFSIVEDDHVCVMKLLPTPQDCVYVSELTLFRLLGGKWQRSDFQLRQRSYAETEVRTALAAAGFGRVVVHDAKHDLLMGGETGRSFFVAQR